MKVSKGVKRYGEICEKNHPYYFYIVGGQFRFI